MENEINNDQAIAQLTGQEKIKVDENTETTVQSETTVQNENIQEPVETAGQQQETQTNDEFDLNTFIEKQGFKSAEEFANNYSDIKGRWDIYKDVEKTKKELKEQQEAFELHTKETEDLFKEANPERIFGSKEAYKNYLIKQEVTKDGLKDASIVDAILTNDLNTFDEMELVFHQKILNTPGLDAEEAIYDIIYNDLGKNADDLQDADGKELKINSKADLIKILKPHEVGKLKMMAAEAKKELLSIKNTEVQADNNYFTSFQSKREAEKQAREEAINKRKESWKPVYDSFKDIKSVQLMDKDKEGNEQVIFDFPIDSGVLSKIDQNVEDYVLTHQIDPTDENIQQVREAFIDGYASKNWEKLVRAALTNSTQQVIQDNMIQNENRKPVNTQMNQEKASPDIAKENEKRLREAGVI